MILFGRNYRVRIEGENFATAHEAFAANPHCAKMIAIVRVRARSGDKAEAKAMADLTREMRERKATVENIRITGIALLKKGEKMERLQVMLAIHADEPPDAFFDRMAAFSHPNRRGEHQIVFLARNRDEFDVTLGWEGGEFTVSAKSWHDHYDDEEQAEWCVRWLLTPYYRLVEEHRGRDWIGSWLEGWEPNGWAPIRPTLSADFRKVLDEGAGAFTITYSQQAVKDPGNYSAYMPGAKLNEDDLPLDSHLGVKTETIPMSVIESAVWAKEFRDEIDAFNATNNA